MRRAAAFALFAAGIVVAAVMLAAAFLASPAGREAIASVAERRIARAVGGEVAIGGLSGDLLRRIEVKDIRFTVDGAEWARIGRATLVWAPRVFLSPRVEINEILIDDAVILARPPARTRPEPFKGFELPERLPALSIDRIALRNARIAGALVPEPLKLDGDGALKMDGAAFALAARIREARGRDDIDIAMERSSAAEAPVLRISIASAPEGAVAALLMADGAVKVSAEGAGSLSAYKVVIAAEAGAYGDISGSLSGDTSRLDEIDFELTARPGVRFHSRHGDLGETVTARGALSRADRGARLSVLSLVGAFGEISGGAEWRNGARALEDAEIDIRARFNANWRPALQDALGAAANLRLSLKRSGRSYAGAATLAAPAANATLAMLNTDLRSTLTGALSAAVSERSSLLRRLRTSARGAGALSLTAKEGLKLTRAEISLANGASFRGDAAYSFEKSRFSIDGTAAANAEAVSSAVPAIVPRGVASSAIKASGTIDDFALSIALDAPDFDVNGSAWPASTISATMSGLPSSPGGEISARARDGSLASSSRVSRTPDGAVSLSGLDHRGTGFALTGDASFNPVKREGAADLRYTGAPGAEPWPGVSIEGEAVLKGALSQERATNRIEARAGALRTKSMKLENLELVATGPAKRLSFTAAAGGVIVRDRLRLERLKAAGTAAISAPTTSLRVTAASAEFEGAPARLTGPFNVELGRGVAIGDLAVSVGDKGAAKFNGSFGPGRWQADAVLRQLPLAAAGAVVDFDLALDTDKPAAAVGAFAAMSEKTGGGAVELKGRYSWDGRKLSVAAEDSAGALDLDLVLPLILRRSGRLGAAMNGALRGSARYDGRAETIALFLPLSLQSLEGDLTFDGALSGSTTDPQLTGQLSLSDGAYTEAVSGFSIVDIDLSAAAAASAASSTVSFEGTASGVGQTAKTITANGAIDLNDGFKIAADVSLKGARFAAGPIERLDATGTLTVAGGVNDLLISGDISLGALEAKIFTPERLGLVDIDVVALGLDGHAVSDGAPASRRPALRYAVRINADNNLFISGRGVDSEWRANAQLAGTAERPLVLGAMNLNRGDLEFSGRRFDLTRGAVGFDALAPNDPTVDLRAERETRDGTTVAVIIAGRSSTLKVSLESTPSLPGEDVMALILFDKPADELSAFQSLQVADSLAQLGGVGVFGGKGVTGAARDALGLDLLNIDVDEADSSASQLTVGKYVTDGLFVSASQNARGENGSVRIEYEIGQSFSVETELRQDGDQTVSANWKKDF